MKKYQSKLTILETQAASDYIKTTFSSLLAKGLSLTKVSAPLFLSVDSGLQDNLNGVEPAVSFKTASGHDCQIVHSLAK
jgi:aspartate--ammonia ligase